MGNQKAGSGGGGEGLTLSGREGKRTLMFQDEADKRKLIVSKVELDS